MTSIMVNPYKNEGFLSMIYRDAIQETSYIPGLSTLTGLVQAVKGAVQGACAGLAATLMCLTCCDQVENYYWVRVVDLIREGTSEFVRGSIQTIPCFGNAVLFGYDHCTHDYYTGGQGACIPSFSQEKLEIFEGFMKID